jgi:hypothetical protein
MVCFGKRHIYRVLVGKPEEKIPLERPACIWKDNIKINQERGWEVWTGLSQLRIGKNGGFL